MYSIRRGAFETNSSSMHTIVLMKDNVDLNDKYTIRAYYDDDSNMLNVSTSNMEFERYPFEPLISWQDKLIYLIATYNTRDRENVEKHIHDLMLVAKKHMPEFKGICFNHLVSFMLDDSCNLTTEYDDEEDLDVDDLGYIDHQSQDTLYPEIEKGRIDIEDFIFNPNWVVMIDGDEYQIFRKMLKSNIIDENRIEKAWDCYRTICGKE